MIRIGRGRSALTEESGPAGCIPREEMMFTVVLKIAAMRNV